MGMHTVIIAYPIHNCLCMLLWVLTEFYFRPNGVSFTAVAGTTEFVNRWNPQPGDIVSFKHRGYLLNSKRPLSPYLYRLRPDLTWETVVNNWKEGVPRKTGIV